MIPNATYRLQFRGDMTFDRAAALVPYLQRLGISHLYASPIFTATSGSTHGYDVTDHNQLDPALGGEAGFDRLTRALADAGLGLILDIVPNHMAASVENPWWRHVLQWGEDSTFARHFDIAWPERLTLPILGKPAADCLHEGEFGFAIDAEHAALALAYYDHRIPLDPRTYGLVFDRVDQSQAAELAALARDVSPQSAGALEDAIRPVNAAPSTIGSLQQALKDIAGDHDLLRSVLEAQHWRLTFWREARENLTYRRFFEVTGLAGVRIEDDAVFEDVHRLVFDLVERGVVTGLRIDHVDGLADPTAYLRKLRDRVGPDIYIVVEKILGPGEALPSTWPIAGTTGYEFIAAIADLMCDEDRFAQFDARYQEAVAPAHDLETERHLAKLRILEINLETELTTLTALAKTASFETAPALASDDLRQAIVAFAVAFDVYRTYVDADGVSADDRKRLDAIADGLRARKDLSLDAVTAVLALLTLDVPQGSREAAFAFVLRFQQTTGPVMAKAVEDTLFYRRNRLIARNEVGGEPDMDAEGVSAFHRNMLERQNSQPHGVLSTATHDTKRGEDARARLYTLSEASEIWAASVARWRQMHSGHVVSLTAGPAPDPETEWLIYQALLGAWPDDLGENWSALAPLAERFDAYLEKAMREAKARTDWTDIDAGFEKSVKAYAAALLDPANTQFLEDFSRTIQPFIRAGALNSLTQTALKLFVPGVPDIYQGSEGWDLSLVDPDNRRPPDWPTGAQLDDLVARPLASVAPNWRDGTLKRWLLARMLQMRTDRKELFAEGAYRPLPVEGSAARHVLAFARVHGDAAIALVVPRLCLDHLGDGEGLTIDPSTWKGTTIDLSDLPEGAHRSLLDDQAVDSSRPIALSDLFGSLPIAVIGH